MKQKLNFQQAALLWAACSMIVVWLGILASDCCEEGVKLTEFLSLFSERLQHPFRLSLNGYTVRCVLRHFACMLWRLAIITHQKEIRERARNTARQNGEMQQP